MPCSVDGVATRACRVHSPGTMQRADHEITHPMKRDELLRLLDTLTPVEHQAITSRVLVADVEAEIARQGALAHAAREPAASTRDEVPKLVVRRKRTVQGTRPPTAPTRPTVRSLAVASKKAPRTLGELRARLESGESPELWAASCELSPALVACIEAEIASLPVPQAPSSTEPPAPAAAEAHRPEQTPEPTPDQTPEPTGDRAPEPTTADAPVPGATVASPGVTEVAAAERHLHLGIRVAAFAVAFVTGLCATQFFL